MLEPGTAQLGVFHLAAVFGGLWKILSGVYFTWLAGLSTWARPGLGAAKKKRLGICCAKIFFEIRRFCQGNAPLCARGAAGVVSELWVFGCVYSEVGWVGGGGSTSQALGRSCDPTDGRIGRGGDYNYD